MGFSKQEGGQICKDDTPGKGEMFPYHIEARDQAGEISFLDNMDILPTLNIFDTRKKEELSPRICGVGSAV